MNRQVSVAGKANVRIIMIFTTLSAQTPPARFAGKPARLIHNKRYSLNMDSPLPLGIRQSGAQIRNASERRRLHPPPLRLDLHLVGWIPYAVKTSRESLDSQHNIGKMVKLSL